MPNSSEMLDELELRTMPSWKLAKELSDLTDELDSIERAMVAFGKGSGKRSLDKRDPTRQRIFEIKNELERRREVRVLA